MKRERNRKTKRGLLIIDRGSREREASDELGTICGRVKEAGGYEFADYCFLEVVPPFIGDGIGRILSGWGGGGNGGAGRIDGLTIVPYFLYPGRKSKIAVAEVMKYQKDTDIRFVVTRPMSMHQTLVDLVRSRISSALEERRIRLGDGEVDVLVIGHGSKDPNAQISLRYVTDGLRRTYRNVDHCFLEIEQPDIAAGIRACRQNSPKALAIVLYFLHEGAHVKRDIYEDLNPALEEAGLENVCITKHLGADQRMVDLIVGRAREVEDAD